MLMSLHPVQVLLPIIARVFRLFVKGADDDWLLRLLWRLKPHYPPSTA